MGYIYTLMLTSEHFIPILYFVVIQSITGIT
jgi:hypothetical protein